MTDRVLKAAYGDDHSYLPVFGLRFPLGIDVRLPAGRQPALLLSGDRRPAWPSRAGSSAPRRVYGALVYSQDGARARDDRADRRHVPRWTRRCASTADRWRFRHPKTRDFIACLSEVTGRDQSWLFDRTFFSSGTVDYAVAEATSTPRAAPRGLFEKDGKLVRRRRPPTSPRPRGYDTLVDRRAPGRRRAAGGRAPAFRGRPNLPVRLGRRGALEALPRRRRAAPDRRDRRSRREDPPRLRPHQQRAASRGRPARRLALDRPRRVLARRTSSTSRRWPGERGRRALVCFGRGLRASLSKPYLGALALADPAAPRRDADPAGRRTPCTPTSTTRRSPTAWSACPDYGWWETFRRTHPDILGNFGDAAEGLLSVATGSSPTSSTACAASAPPRSPSRCSRSSSTPSRSAACFGTLREPSSSLVTFGREGMRRLPAFLAFTLAAFAGAAAALPLDLRGDGPRARATASQELSTEGAGARRHGTASAGAPRRARGHQARWPTRSGPSGSRGPDLPPVSRFLMGLGGAIARPRRLFGVLLWYVLLTAGLYVIWIVLDPPAGGEARFALVPLILTQQVFVFVRSLVKVGYYAGISEALTRTPSPEYSYVAPASRPSPQGRRKLLTTPLSTVRPAASRRTRKRKGRRRNTPFASDLPGPREPGQEAQVLPDDDSVPPSGSDRTTVARGKRAKRRYASTSGRARAAASAADGGGWRKASDRHAPDRRIEVRRGSRGSPRTVAADADRRDAARERADVEEADVHRRRRGPRARATEKATGTAAARRRGRRVAVDRRAARPRARGRAARRRRRRRARARRFPPAAIDAGARRETRARRSA